MQLIYVVTTDDPKWCKESFAKFNRTIVYSADAEFVQPGKRDPDLDPRNFDLAVASLCHHTIFDYGTFGFWGAYFAGGHTILAHNMVKNAPYPKQQVAVLKLAKFPEWEFLEAFLDI